MVEEWMNHYRKLILLPPHTKPASLMKSKRTQQNKPQIGKNNNNNNSNHNHNNNGNTGSGKLSNEQGSQRPTSSIVVPNNVATSQVCDLQIEAVYSSEDESDDE